MFAYLTVLIDKFIEWDYHPLASGDFKNPQLTFCRTHLEVEDINVSK